MFKQSFLLSLLFLLITTSVQAASSCGDKGVGLQVLGSGGPELDDSRASSGYVIWHDGRARILVDVGGGSLLNFEKSGASLNDLHVILLSHLHTDHSSDLPALIKASFFSGRQHDLPIYGPNGNHLMPAMTHFVQRLFGPDGAYRYLSDYLDGRESYRLLPHDVQASGKTLQRIKTALPYVISAVPVHHGPVPSLAWRVDIEGHSLVFSGDMNNQNDVLAGLAKQADILVAHHAIPQEAGGVARNLHMPPSVIGEIAAKARVKQLLLSHRMQRTLGHEDASRQWIRRTYNGPLRFAEDLQCIRP